MTPLNDAVFRWATLALLEIFLTIGNVAFILYLARPAVKAVLGRMDHLNDNMATLVKQTAVANRRQVKQEWKASFARFLRELPPGFFTAPARRATLVKSLPPSVRDSLTRSDAIGDDLVNMLYCVCDYNADAVRDFLNAVAEPLGDSDSGVQFAALRAELGI